MREDVVQVGGGRRAARRRATIAEVLDTSLEVMAQDGVAALSLAEVARRMGMRPPSLYQYFASKTAVYDALFAEGNRRLEATIDESMAAYDGSDPLAAFCQTQDRVLRWCVENPVLTQLLFWRPVPGFEPSEQAYEPSLRIMDKTRRVLRDLVRAGELAPAGATDKGVALYTVLVSGLISQQLANDPQAPFDSGRFTRLSHTAMDMFFQFYAPQEGEPHADRRPRRRPRAH